MSEQSEQNVILVVDDEKEFRNLAINTLSPVLPEGWEVIAPETLELALQTLTNTKIRIALIDRSIDSEGYQALTADGITYENVRGFQIARLIKNQYPHIVKIAFSKGHGKELEGCVDTVFHHKVGIAETSHSKDELRKNFQQMILEIIESLD